VDFRHRLRNIAKKLKANPRPCGALVDGIDADGRLSPEIADLRRKAIEILKAGWRRMDPMKVIPNPPDSGSLSKSSQNFGRNPIALQQFDKKDMLNSGDQSIPIDDRSREESADHWPNFEIFRLEKKSLESVKSYDFERVGDLVDQVKWKEIDDCETMVKDEIKIKSLIGIESVGERYEVMVKLWRSSEENREPEYITNKGGGVSDHNHCIQFVPIREKMDKMKEVAAGKKKVSEEHSSAGENITPFACRAGARPSAANGEGLRCQKRN
jgi:hypothetical protein